MPSIGSCGRPPTGPGGVEVCSYCGCESEKVIAVLMDDHERIGLLCREAQSAVDDGDRDRGVSLCREIARLFDVHAGKEQEGLFRELRAERLADDVVDRLEGDHRALVVALALLAAGDLTDMDEVLAALIDHAEREDSDLFPAALQLVPNEAWSRISSS